MRIERHAGVVACLAFMFLIYVKADGAEAYENMALSVTVPEGIPLGANISFAVTLKAKTKQSVILLGTADLLITIQDVLNARRKYVHKRGRSRFHVQTYDGITLRRTVEVEKRQVEMQVGEKATTTISVLNEIGTRLAPGAYSVSVLYEGALKAEAKFAVVVDYEKTMPALIDLVAGTEHWSRLWARERLFAIIGKPEWKPASTDTREKVKLEVEKLRQWWKDHRDIIRLVSRTIEENQKMLLNAKKAKMPDRKDKSRTGRADKPVEK